MSATVTPQEEALQLASLSPASFAHVVSAGGWVPWEHLILLNDYLIRLEAREITRLIVTMPPRHGKSELISRYMPAWYLGKNPDHRVMLTSFGDKLATGHGGAARRLLKRWGPLIFGVETLGESDADWGIKDRNGSMVSRSVRGELTGKGAHLFIIDDPIKDELAAASERNRETVWSWWQATASTRLELMGDKAVAILVQTRWHEDDLAARLKAQEGWEVLNLPALAEAPETLTPEEKAEWRDEIGRKQGEPLAAELIDTAGYEQLKREKGSYFFSALYQQKPMPAEGVMFKRKHFRYYRIEEEMVGAMQVKFMVIEPEGDLGQQEGPARRIDLSHCTIFQTADVAISDKDTADYTVVSTFAITAQQELLVLDVQRRQFEEQQVIAFLKEQNGKYGRPRLYVERFGAGRSPLAILKREGYPVQEIPAEAGTQQNKVTRAFVAVAAYERHAVYHPYPYPEWLESMENELTSFPNAAHDDQVDTISYGCRLMSIVGPGEYIPKHTRRPMGAGIKKMQF